MNRPSKDVYLMTLATVAALRTTCVRRAVGCVLADYRGRVLSVGYNGVAPGLPHCNESKISRLCSVPARPKPEHWEDPGAVYLERARELNPTADWIPLHVIKAWTEESTVKGHVAVAVEHLPHACLGHDLEMGKDSCEAVHAEQNALIQCPDPDRIASAYVTTAPCKACMKLLLGTGCTRILFLDEHRDVEEVARIWQGAGREWLRMDHAAPMLGG